jgi:hypothetical protein
VDWVPRPYVGLDAATSKGAAFGGEPANEFLPSHSSVYRGGAGLLSRPGDRLAR